MWTLKMMWPVHVVRWRHECLNAVLLTKNPWALMKVAIASPLLLVCPFHTISYIYQVQCLGLTCWFFRFGIEVSTHKYLPSGWHVNGWAQFIVEWLQVGKDLLELRHNLGHMYLRCSNWWCFRCALVLRCRSLRPNHQHIPNCGYGSVALVQAQLIDHGMWLVSAV